MCTRVLKQFNKYYYELHYCDEPGTGYGQYSNQSWCMYTYWACCIHACLKSFPKVSQLICPTLQLTELAVGVANLFGPCVHTYWAYCIMLCLKLNCFLKDSAAGRA